MRGGYLRLALLALGAIFLAVVPAVESEAQFPASPDTIGGWTAGPPTVYAGRDLTRYIDGAAEVYFAYHFRAVSSRQYTAPAHAAPITLDIFDMGSPADAFGAFTFERMEATAGIGQGSEYAAGLLRFWQNRFFVSVYTPVDTAASRDAILALGKAVAENMPGPAPEPNLVNALPRDGMRDRSLRYFHNAAQLNYLFYLSSSNFLLLGPETECVLGSYDLGGGHARVLVVSYPDARAAESGCRSFLDAFSRHATGPGEFEIPGHGWSSCHLQGNEVYAVFEAPDADALHRLTDATNLRVWRQLRQ